MNFHPRKRFGQHWLKSEKALSQIIAAANLNNSDHVLEIGPGTGILTHRLLAQVNSLVSVEIDRDLCKKLVKNFGQKENFLLLQGDILSLDLPTQLSQFPQFQPLKKVVANIPYNITGPILEKLLGTISYPQKPAYDLMVLLMQKEVAERLVGKPGTKAYGALSVRVQYLAKCDWIADVPRFAFEPPPKVDSAIIRLSPYEIENPANNPRFLDRVVKLGFATRRKMLRNNLKSLLDSDRLALLLEQFEISPEARAEELSLSQWIDLSNLLETLI